MPLNVTFPQQKKVFTQFPQDGDFTVTLNCSVAPEELAQAAVGGMQGLRREGYQHSWCGMAEKVKVFSRVLLGS